MIESNGICKFQKRIVKHFVFFLRPQTQWKFRTKEPQSTKLCILSRRIKQISSSAKIYSFPQDTFLMQFPAGIGVSEFLWS